MTSEPELLQHITRRLLAILPIPDIQGFRDHLVKCPHGEWSFSLDTEKQYVEWHRNIRLNVPLHQFCGPLDHVFCPLTIKKDA